MNTLGRQTLLWMIPLDLVLVAWVWFGRMVFGVGGWFLTLMTAFAGLTVVAWGTLVVILTATRRSADDPAVVTAAR